MQKPVQFRRLCKNHAPLSSPARRNSPILASDQQQQQQQLRLNHHHQQHRHHDAHYYDVAVIFEVSVYAVVDRANTPIPTPFLHS